ncbi:MAG: tyrosine-type recombinase/integrase [Blastocatellia bacterium]
MKRKKKRGLGYLKRGDSYYFNFSIKGRRYREVIEKATDEQTAANEVVRRKSAIIEGRDGEPDKSMPFEEFVETIYLKWSKHNKRSYYLDTRYAELFCKHFKGKTLRQVTPLAVEQFKQKRREGLTIRREQRSVGSVNRELSVLSSIFGRAVKYGFLDVSPCQGMELYKNYNQRDRVVTADEEQKILAAMTGRLERLRPLMILALNTGMRRKEMLKLWWSDVDFDRGQIKVRAENSKSKKPRTLPMNSITKELFEQLRENAPDKYLVFSGKGYSTSSVSNNFSDLCETLGMSDVTLHTLRHTFSTRLKDANVNPFVIRDLLGHSTVQITEGYVHETPGTHQEAIKRLENQSNCHTVATNEKPVNPTGFVSA